MPMPSWKHTLVPFLLLSATQATQASVGHAASAPPPDDEVEYELLELRGTLAEQGEQRALENTSYFRPLCDDDGYPLVGNMLPKDGDDMTPVLPPYQPSEFCAHVRNNESKA